jgi:ATP-dependent Clp protease, protease subunit
MKYNHSYKRNQSFSNTTMTNRKPLQTEPIEHEEMSFLEDHGYSPSLRVVNLLPVNVDDDGESSGIDEELFRKTIIALNFLEKIDGEKPIKFYLSSDGGNWNSALALYDRIRACPCPTTIEAYGEVSSAAPVVLQAADKRLIAPNSTIVIHDTMVSTEKEARNLEALARYSGQVDRKRMYEILAQRSKYPTSYWKEICAKETFFTAKKALAYGLVDRLIEPSEIVNPDYPRFHHVQKIQQRKKK